VAAGSQEASFRENELKAFGMRGGLTGLAGDMTTVGLIGSGNIGGTVARLAVDAGTLTSSEYLQRHIPEASVVKVFNNIFFKHLASLSRPADAADRSYLPIAGEAGDDSGDGDGALAAKAVVTRFLDSIGYGAIDGGPLSQSWRQQPGTPAYGTPYGSYDDEKGTPAGADVIRAALAAAAR
jgi:hypothetical protein